MACIARQDEQLHVKSAAARTYNPPMTPVSFTTAVPHANLNSGQDKPLERFFWLAVLVGLGLSVWYQINQIVDGDQLQMIQRGYAAAYQGLWPVTGNTASVVGNVPGFVSTAVVAGPLMLWDSPYAPIVLLVLLRLIGFLLIDAVVREAVPGSMALRLWLVVLLWLNPWVQFDSLLYNPAYLIFCFGLHFYSAWRLRAAPSFWWSFWHVVAIGLAVQMHFSWPLLAFVSVYLWWRQLVRVNWWGVVAAASVAVISLLPYLLAVLSNPEIARHSDPGTQERYIGWGAVNVYPILKSLIYWLRYGAWAFPSKLVNDAGFDWATGWQSLELALVWIWRIGQYVLAALTMMVALGANIVAWFGIRHHWRRRDGLVQDGVTWLLLYSFGAFLAMLVSSGLSPIVFNYWHLALILPAALMPVVLWTNQTFSRESTVFVKAVLIVAAVFVATNLVAINDSRKFSWSADYTEQVRQYVDTQIRQTPR